MNDNSVGALAAYQDVRRLVIGALLVLLCIGLAFVGTTQSDAWHERLESIGVLVIVTGIAGRLWSILYIGGRKSAEIVDDGPYSVTRNPLYLFSAIAAAGVGAQTGSLLVALAFFVLCAVAFQVVILREERYLAAMFGESYRDYVSRVPRFFPNPWLFRDRPEVTFQPRTLKRTLVDGLVFFISVPFFEMIEHAHESGVLPVLLKVF